MKEAAICLLFLLIGTQSVLPSNSSQIVWLNDFQQALSKSKETGKPVFVDCFAEWCVWCHKMEAEVYSDTKFVNMTGNYVMLRIDIEDGAEGSRIAANYNVETLPSLLVVDSSGRLINRIGGFLKTDELIADLTKMQDLINGERLNANDWMVVQTLAEEYLFRDMNAEAETRFARILNAPVSDVSKESAHFSLALSQYYQQKNQEALRTLDTYLQTYVEGNSAEEVLLLLSQIYVEMDEHEKAKQVLQQFLKKFPDSKSVGRARKVLELLEKNS
jgi:thioredoxin-like negative regulator of GroEL